MKILTLPIGSVLWDTTCRPNQILKIVSDKRLLLDDDDVPVHGVYAKYQTKGKQGLRLLIARNDEAGGYAIEPAQMASEGGRDVPWLGFDEEEVLEFDFYTAHLCFNGECSFHESMDKGTLLRDLLTLIYPAATTELTESYLRELSDYQLATWLHDTAHQLDGLLNIF